MKRAVIIGSGSINDYAKIKSLITAEDFIICADGGYDHAAAMGIRPHILIGDFDSIKDMPQDTEILKYPAKKDLTDSELAMKEAQERGFSNMLLLGFTGDRADHTMTNILMLAKFPNAVLRDDNNEIRIIKDRCEIHGKKGDTISIIPIGGDLCGITTSGLEYPLSSETLFFGKSRGVSNVMNSDVCTVECMSGMGMIVKVDNV